MARGRKRKAGKRHPSGKLVQPRRAESQSDIMGTALDARQRHYGIGAKQARDERLGTALGRLSFAGKITPEQYAAGELYGELMARHNAVMGLPIDQPRSVTGPRAASCRISLSSVRSDTARRNRAFSFSNSFIRRT